MQTEDDRAIDGHDRGNQEAKFGAEEAPLAMDTDAALESGEPARHADSPILPGPDLVLDERLNSAAAPFLYLLAVVLIVVAGYFVYLLLLG